MWYNYFAYFGIRFFRYVCITYWNNVTATFYFRTSFWRNFFTPRLRYLFVQWSYFCLTTLQVPYIFVRLNCVNCVRKLSYKLLFFSFTSFLLTNFSSIWFPKSLITVSMKLMLIFTWSYFIYFAFLQKTRINSSKQFRKLK